MKTSQAKKTSNSRRKLLTTLGWSSLIALFGFKNYKGDFLTSNEEEYQTLLKSNGTIVKVKKSIVQNSKIVKKDISNKSFFNWVEKKHNV